MKIIILITSMCFVFLASIKLSDAITLSSDLVNYEVTDYYYINKRCEEDIKLTIYRTDYWSNNLDTVIPIMPRPYVDVKFKSIKHTVNKMKKLCASYYQGEISGDSWLEQFEALSAQTSVCGIMVSCAPRILSPPKPIPNNFKIYVMFLFPSAEWKNSIKHSDIIVLMSAFNNFGEAIGNKHAAIWFSTDTEKIDPDIMRCKYYCDKLKLDYNKGPFIVVSKIIPNLLTKLDDYFVIQLNGITATRVFNILNVLEKNIRTNSDIKKRKLLYEEIVQALMSLADVYPDMVGTRIKALARGQQ